MIPACLIVGDSIGVGMAGALAMQGIHCEVRAQVGATSKRVLDLQPVIAATGHAVIAAGSNDPAIRAWSRICAVSAQGLQPNA